MTDTPQSPASAPASAQVDAERLGKIRAAIERNEYSYEGTCAFLVRQLDARDARIAGLTRERDAATDCEAMWRDRAETAEAALAQAEAARDEAVAIVEPIVTLARDLVALWQSPRIQELPRADRNAAIEETRQRMIEAVAGLPAAPASPERTPDV